MTSSIRPRLFAFATALLTSALGAGVSTAASLPIHCFPDSVLPFPRIAVCAFPGRWQDSTAIQPYRCAGAFMGPQPDSVVDASRTVTVRFKRDRRAEARPDFGGYRIYRVIDQPDTSSLVLLRRFSPNDSLLKFGIQQTWFFSTVDRNPASPTYLQFMCGGEVVHDSIVTFMDPDSSGSYQKRCHILDASGRCLSPKDSILALVPPPGPHDGFRTWYTVTYEASNLLVNAYDDLFVPDTSGDFARCDTTGLALVRWGTDSAATVRLYAQVLASCPNQNNKALNLTSTYLEPTSGPAANLEQAGVVPNPYRAHAPWDPTAGTEVHFVRLPQHAVIKVFTVAGDLVTTIKHDDPVRDFERWNLKNGNGQDVASGIYIYRIEGGSFTRQDRFIIIR